MESGLEAGAAPVVVRESGTVLASRKAYKLRPNFMLAFWCKVPRKEGAIVKVELTPDAAQWVEAELAAGRFPTAEDAIRYAVNYAKLAELRAELEAAEAEGGKFTTDDVRRFAREHGDNEPST